MSFAETRCGRSLTEPPGRPKVSNIAGDLRSAVSAGSETLAEQVSPSNFIFGGEGTSFSTIEFRPPPKMKFERLT
jgi:hypothetical protein